jgi:hypothetical protein
LPWRSRSRVGAEQSRAGWEIPQSAGLAATPGRSRGGAQCAGGGGGPFGPNHPPRRVVENGRVCFVQVTEGSGPGPQNPRSSKDSAV